MLVPFTRNVLLPCAALLCSLGFCTLGAPNVVHAQYPGSPYRHSQPNQRIKQQRGATLGGLMGAVAGGLIGDNNGEAGAGAAIGGVIGAVTGGMLGNAADKETVARQQQRSYLATQQQATLERGAVSMNDIVQMSRSGLSENVIITQIQNRGVITQPQVADIIAMHQQNVSERVITAMQQAPTRQQVTARPAISSPPARAVTPVFIQEHVLPVYPPPGYYHHPHDHFYHGSGFHGAGFHLDFGH